LAIFENDVINKKIIAEQTSNNVGNQDTKNDDMHFMEEWSKGTTLIDDNLWVLNIKLSGMYYIDGMEFLFNHDYNEIIQILYLIKKGKTTGYNNKHTPPHVPEIEKRDTLPEDRYTTVPADMNNIYA
jgi:hypothetical protein